MSLSIPNEDAVLINLSEALVPFLSPFIGCHTSSTHAHTLLPTDHLGSSRNHTPGFLQPDP